MKTVITIGREYGSGGHQIGYLLAKKLNIPFYDDELLDRAAKDSGFAKEILKTNDEKPTSSFLYSLVMDNSFGYTGSMFGDMNINQKVFLAQFEAIKHIAAEGPCVIIGRCADYALDENPDLLSVFIYANQEERIKRIAEKYNIPVKQAKDRIIKTDKKRSNYYNYYADREWGRAQTYDLCINTSIFGIDGAVDAIINAVEIKEKGHEITLMNSTY